MKIPAFAIVGWTVPLTVLLLPKQQPPQPVATATYNATHTSAPLTTTGDNGPALQALFDAAPEDSIVTFPVGDWPIRSPLRMKRFIIRPPASGTAVLRFTGDAVVPPPPVEPPPIPVPPPSSGTPEGAAAILRWDGPTAGIHWTEARYSSGGYTSPLMLLAPGATDLVVKAKRGSLFTVELVNLDADSNPSAMITAEWQVPTSGPVPAPKIVYGTQVAVAVPVPLPGDPSLWMQ